MDELTHGALSATDKTRILNEGTETYSTELSDSLWPYWAPHKSTIAVEPKASLHGSYSKDFVEIIEAVIKKVGEVKIKTAQGSDDKWRGGSSLVTGHHGSYSSPGVNSEVFGTQKAAIEAEILKIEKSLIHRHQNEYNNVQKNKIVVVTKAFYEWVCEWRGATHEQIELFDNS